MILGNVVLFVPCSSHVNILSKVLIFILWHMDGCSRLCCSKVGCSVSSPVQLKQ